MVSCLHPPPPHLQGQVSPVKAADPLQVCNRCRDTDLPDSHLQGSFTLCPLRGHMRLPQSSWSWSCPPHPHPHHHQVVFGAEFPGATGAGKAGSSWRFGSGWKLQLLPALRRHHPAHTTCFASQAAQGAFLSPQVGSPRRTAPSTYTNNLPFCSNSVRLRTPEREKLPLGAESAAFPQRNTSFRPLRRTDAQVIHMLMSWHRCCELKQGAVPS